MTSAAGFGEPEPDEVVASAESARGEVLLRRRGRDGALELRVNGVFVMDTVETSTERAIATLAVDELESAHGRETLAGLRIVVGGLGLGFTLAALVRQPSVAEIVVAEIEPAVVEWHRAGLIPHTTAAVADPRVRLEVGDVRDIVAAEPPHCLDAVILDVDNGPGYLVYDDNAGIYERWFFEECRQRLKPAGQVIVWSGHDAPFLHETLAAVFGKADLHHMAVQLGDRSDHYEAYVAPGRPPDESTEDG